jgi:poly-gamma-glutamate capsule biosynthesis protein CapA/YwtB (metallophosphatase superfamily)
MGLGMVVLAILLAHPDAVASKTVNAEESEQLTLVIGGDLGLGGSGQRVDQRGALRHGKLYPWTALTKQLAGLVDGDVNFANLESIVTTNNALRPGRKAFTFRSHPTGVRHLVDIGFNVFSTANNHVGDYGAKGMRETLSELGKLRSHGLQAYPGLGATRDEAGRPAAVESKGQRLLFSAIGIGGWRPSNSTPGILGYYSKRDFNEAVDRLAHEKADYRVLSVHYGIELDVRPSRQDIRRLRDQAVRSKGIDLVVGHHAHVPAGVQEINGRLIFYGLGNLLHPGMQDMSRFGPCRDYGLLAKVHLSSNETGQLSARAVEVWPLERMHLKARQMTSRKAKRRIQVLNKLAREFDDENSGARGIRFLARENGSGLACLDGAANAGGKIGELCGNWDTTSVALEPSSPLSCARRRLVKSSRRKTSGKHRRAQSSPSVLEQIFGW